MPRFVLLEHTDAPHDPAGRHYDLLLEDGDGCRTWRLTEVPAPGGQAVAAVAIARHRLAWLDHESGEVSGGRGFARRIDAGIFRGVPGDGVEDSAEYDLCGVSIRGRLWIGADGRCLMR